MKPRFGAGFAGDVMERWRRAPPDSWLTLNEGVARYCFRQFVTTVAYCHMHSVAHRAANVLLGEQTLGE